MSNMRAKNTGKRLTRTKNTLSEFIRTETMSEYFASIPSYFVTSENPKPVISLESYLHYFRTVLRAQYESLGPSGKNAFSSLSRAGISHLICSSKPMYVYLGILSFMAFKICESSDNDCPTDVYMPEVEMYFKDVIRSKLSLLEQTPNIHKFCESYVRN